MRIFIILLFSVLVSTHLKAQTEGKVEIIRDAKIDSLVKRHRAFLESKTTIKGYRIQLFFGTDRAKANEMKTAFLQKYPTLNAYLIYQQPNFKVRVGDFKSRLEATKYVKQLNIDFNSAFIVHDDIKFGN
jgi:hypothetical protein